MEEITKEYGSFDACGRLRTKIDGETASDVIHCYRVVTGKTGYFGTSPNIYYCIKFSEDDIAISTKIGPLREELQ